jgi:beta-xylosidase
MKNILFVAMITAFTLSACSTPAIPPVQTNTSISLPSETPILSTATATLEPSSTPNPLIFRDDFNSSLGEGWQWIRENNKYWSLTSNPGWLKIVARSGHVGDGSMQNLLMQQAPAGDFELETKLQFKPTENFEIAGLLVYATDKNYIQFGRAFCNAPQCAGDGFYLDLVVDGNFSSDNFATSAPDTDTVYLRLRREGNIFTGYVSEDAQEWKAIGAHNSDMKPLLVGLVAGQAVNSVPKPALFDYFVINSLP